MRYDMKVELSIRNMGMSEARFRQACRIISQQAQCKIPTTTIAVPHTIQATALLPKARASTMPDYQFAIDIDEWVCHHDGIKA